MEQQPRAQSKGEVVTANQGRDHLHHALSTREGSRGYYRVNLRHGVSRVHHGTHYTPVLSSTTRSSGQ